MSWIDKELKRRAAASRRSVTPQPADDSASERIQDLWAKLQRANSALPSELQLSLEQDNAFKVPNEPAFVAWLRARNSAALGFAGDGIRYIWPEAGRRWSNNFWIRWDNERQRYLLARRVGTPATAIVVTYAFNVRRIDYMIKRLVMGKRIRARAIRKKVLGLF